MCNVGSCPERDEEMDADDAKRYIEDVLRLGEIRNVGLTGGEPLLRPEKVLELAQHAESHGLKSGISTNAFWGSPEEEASALVTGLKQAGVVHLWISTDAFHAEFIPLATVKNALHAAMGQRMAFYVQSTYLFPEADVFGAQGMYDGPLHNDYDRQTRAIQEELSAVLPGGSYGWGRVIFRSRAVSLKPCLGDDLERAEHQLAKALDSIPNYDGRVDDRLVISMFPDGSIEANGKHIGRVSEEGVDAAVREWCSRSGLDL
jgi:organic radical activating enzyme